MPKIITSSKLFNIDEKKGIEILENFSLKDIQNKPENMFRKYFLGNDEEYEKFLVGNQLKIDYDKFTRDDLIFKFTPYLERFCSRVDNSTFDSILQSIHKTKQVNSKMLMQEIVYDFSDFSKEDFTKFIKEYEYKSSSLLSFMTIDEVNQKIKTYAINKNLVELKEIKEDIDNRDNYLKISVDIAKSVPRLEPRLDLKGVKANTMSGIKQNTITLTELQNIYRTLSKVDIYDIALYNRNFHNAEIGNAVYFPSNFLHESELNDLHVKFETEFEAIKENATIEKKPTTIKNIDKVTKVQGGSLNKGAGYEKVVEEEATKVKVEDKVTIDDIEDDTNYSEFTEELNNIEKQNEIMLSEHIDAEIEILKKTKELIPKATTDTLEAIQKGSTISNALLSLKQAHRKYPQLPMLVEENLRIKFLSIKAKDTILNSMESKIDTTSKTIDIQNKTIEERDAKISTLKTLNSVLDEKYNKDVKELTDAIDKITIKFNELKNNSDIQEELLNEQDKIIENKEKELININKEIISLNKTTQELEQKNSTLENKLIEKVSFYEHKIEDLIEQIKARDDIVKSKDFLITTLQSELQAKNRIIDTSSKEISDKTNQINSLFDVKADNEKLKHIIEEFKKQNKILAQQNVILDNANKDLQSKTKDIKTSHSLLSKVKEVGTIEADIRGSLITGNGITLKNLRETFSDDTKYKNAVNELEHLVELGYAEKVNGTTFIKKEYKNLLLSNLNIKTDKLQKVSGDSSNVRDTNTSNIKTKRRYS